MGLEKLIRISKSEPGNSKNTVLILVQMPLLKTGARQNPGSCRARMDQEDINCLLLPDLIQNFPVFRQSTQKGKPLDPRIIRFPNRVTNDQSSIGAEFTCAPRSLLAALLQSLQFANSNNWPGCHTSRRSARRLHRDCQSTALVHPGHELCCDGDLIRCILVHDTQ